MADLSTRRQIYLVPFQQATVGHSTIDCLRDKAGDNQNTKMPVKQPFNCLPAFLCAYNLTLKLRVSNNY